MGPRWPPTVRNRTRRRTTRGVEVHCATRSQRGRIEPTTTAEQKENASRRRAYAPKRYYSWCALSPKSAEFGIHHRKAVAALHVIHLGDAQHCGKNFRRDFHGAWLGRGARRRLRKGGGCGGVKGHIAFDLTKMSVNVT